MAFEIARRHRFTTDMAALPDSYRDFSKVSRRIDRASEATRRYLAEQDEAGG